MQLRYLISAISFLLFSINVKIEANKGEIALNFNSDTLIRALGTPICLRKCIDPFLGEVANLWQMREMIKNVKALCRSHEIALECIRKHTTCDPHNLFKTASSSVEKMCGERASLFEKVRPCLNKNGDIPMQVCDTRCHGRSNITAFMNNPAITMAALMGGNIFAVNEHLSGLCSALNCALPCITIELNNVCPLSGWLALDILLQPFESVANHLMDSSSTLKDFITNRINKKCKFVVQKSELMKLRKGQFNY